MGKVIDELIKKLATLQEAKKKPQERELSLEEGG